MLKQTILLPRMMTEGDFYGWLTAYHRQNLIGQRFTPQGPQLVEEVRKQEGRSGDWVYLSPPRRGPLMLTMHARIEMTLAQTATFTESRALELGQAMTFTELPQSSGVRIEAHDPAFDDCLRSICHAWSGTKPTTEKAVEKAKEPGEAPRPERKKRKAKKRKPTIKTEARANLYKSIKDKRPELSRSGLAAAANKQENSDVHTEDTVRNAYRAMRWIWKRADRVR